LSTSTSIGYVQGAPKNDPTCFHQNFVKSRPKLIVFGTQIDKMINHVRYTHCPPHLVYVNALPCTTQMLQIVA